MSTKLKEHQINVPEGVNITQTQLEISVKKDAVEVSRLLNKFVKISQEGNVVTVAPINKSSNARVLCGTFAAHVKNMIKGVQEPFTYKLKIVGTHFPITVNQSGNELQIQNFIGEKKPRKVKLAQGVDFKIEGDVITIQSPDIELAGMVAARIEQATKIKGKDRRIFQDGIYLTLKAGKSVI